MKSSLFDVQGLVDYMLYRLNLKYAYKVRRWRARQLKKNDELHDGDAEHSSQSNGVPLPVYLTDLAMPPGEEVRPTNDVDEFLRWAATRAPGTLLKGGERDWDACAQFIVQRFREGKLGVAELDLGIEELQGGATHPTEDPSFGVAPIDEETGLPKESVEDRINRIVSQHFEMTEAARRFGVTRKSWERPPRSQEVADESATEEAEFDDASSTPATPESEEPTSSASQSSLATGADVPSSADLDAGLATHPLLSNHQQRKRVKAQQLFEQREKLRAKGLLLMGSSKEAKLEKDRRKHKEWLIRTGKLRLRGAYAKVKRIKKTGKTIRG